jgi:hypothetical protein
VKRGKGKGKRECNEYRIASKKRLKISEPNNKTPKLKAGKFIDRAIIRDIEALAFSFFSSFSSSSSSSSSSLLPHSAADHIICSRQREVTMDKGV